MKQYRSHKVVEAAKIEGVSRCDADPGVTLHFADSETACVPLEWIRKHAPGGTLAPQAFIGGYFVRYPDGYTSWSPAAAFEEGYTEHSLHPKDGALPVAGYKPQTPATVAFVNALKEQEERTLRLLDQLDTVGADVVVQVEAMPAPDLRWVAIARTSIQQGFMAAARAVFQPGRVKLPEDERDLFAQS
jgi:hypothetical protein